jgi:hypothetical protein
MGSKTIFHLEAFVAKGMSASDLSDNSDENHRQLSHGIILNWFHVGYRCNNIPLNKCLSSWHVHRVNWSPHHGPRVSSKDSSKYV